jgi:hypothetical protein
MSATVLLDPAAELYSRRRSSAISTSPLRIVAQADARPELNLLTRALAGTDAAEIATGKAYQLCWNLVGLAKLHRATGDARLREAVSKRLDLIRTIT